MFYHRTYCGTLDWLKPPAKVNKKKKKPTNEFDDYTLRDLSVVLFSSANPGAPCKLENDSFLNRTRRRRSCGVLFSPIPDPLRLNVFVRSRPHHASPRGLRNAARRHVDLIYFQFPRGCRLNPLRRPNIDD